MEQLFVKSLIKSWIEYMDYSDRMEYKVNAQDISPAIQALNENSRIDGDKLIIENQNVFNDINKTLEIKDNKDKLLYLYFPVFYKNECAFPIILVKIQDIFNKPFKPDGWDITDFEYSTVSVNIKDILGLDEDEDALNESLIQDNQNLISIKDFLINIFNLNFEYEVEINIENICNKIYNAINNFNNYNVINKPSFNYFQITSDFNKKLRVDLWKIYDEIAKLNYLYSNLAFKYIHNKDLLIKDLYFGDLGENAPTFSQAEALYYSDNEIVAVQGPPGSGKTTVLLRLIANQIVKRALSLILDNKDINNFTIISSTNNRAVDNVIERLEAIDNDENNSIFLLAGNREKIKEKTANKISQKIESLRNKDYDETTQNLLKNEIKCIYNEIDENKNIIKNIFLEMKDKLREIEQLNKYIEETEQKKLKKNNEIESLINELKNLCSDFGIQQNEIIKMIIYDDYKNSLQLLSNEIENLNNEWFLKKLLNKILKKDFKLYSEFCKTALIQINQTHIYNQKIWLELPVSIIDIEIKKNQTNRIIQDYKQITILREKNERITNEIQELQNQIVEFNKRIDDCNEIIKNDKEEFRKIVENIANDSYKTEILQIFENESIDVHSIFNYYHLIFFELNQNLYFKSKDFLYLEALKRKSQIIDILKDYEEIINGNNQRNAFTRWAHNTKQLFLNISLVFPIVTTTLQSARNILPYCDTGLIDKVIIDEAAMVHNYMLFPLLYRAKKCIIVGDPYQILPINKLDYFMIRKYKKVFLKEYFEQHQDINSDIQEAMFLDYSPHNEEASAYHLARRINFDEAEKDKAIKEIYIKDHFRCATPIANCFNNLVDYGLILKNNEKETPFGTNLLAFHIEGEMSGKVNIKEIDAVKEIVKKLLDNGYKLEDIGVISPYRIHSDEIKKELKDLYDINNDSVGTVHTFQGGEKKVIICSTRIHSVYDSPNFINNKPNLLNVAISRAKELFILVGNLDKIRISGGYLGQMLNCIKNNGKIFEINPVPKEVQKYKNEDKTRLITNCEHIKIFNEIIKNCENELIIVCPWIRDIAAQDFYNLVKNMNYNIKIYYGWKRDEIQDDEQINRIRQLNNVEITDLTSEQSGTHEKIVIADRKIAIVGSWNWLSHKYFWFCKKEAENNLIVRNETSIYTENQNIIKELLKRIVKKN